MCIAILKTPNGEITKEQLEQCFASNPDMAGLAFVNHAGDGKPFLDIWKGYKDFKSFYEDYESLVKDHKGNILIHFRIATSGGVNEYNCHPFRVKDDLVMIHNGILNCVTVPKNSKENDTQIFIDEYLKGLPTKIYGNKYFKKILGDQIGHNKLVFLDINDNYYIINESLGHWSNGCWFSNYSYEQLRWSKKTTQSDFRLDGELYGKDYNDWAEYYNDWYTEEDTVDKKTCEICGTNLTDGEDALCEFCVEELCNTYDLTPKELTNKKLCKFCMELYDKDNTQCPECGSSTAIDLKNITIPIEEDNVQELCEPTK